jgi:hypothetical protein
MASILYVIEEVQFRDKFPWSIKDLHYVNHLHYAVWSIKPCQIYSWKILLQ